MMDRPSRIFAPRPTRIGVRARAALLVPVLLGLLGPPLAAADRFVITAGDKQNEVRFDSKAPVESFAGTTRQIQGSIEVTPAALGDSITVSAEVDMASLDTGIALRNEHMRKNHLETDRYPKARFHGAALRKPHPSALTADAVDTLTVVGTFELHGVTHRLTIPVSVTYAAHATPPALHVVGHFPVALGDYAIKRPQFLMMRLSQVQQVTVDVHATLAK